MRKFLIRTALFLLPVIAFGLAADYYLTKKFRSADKGLFAVWNDLLEGRINADVVIYGSSRAQVQIDPKAIENGLGTRAYNLGVNGHNFYMEYLRHKLLLEHNSKPKLIVISLDNVTFDKRTELFQMEQFAPYLHNEEIAAATATYVGFGKFDYRLPFLRYLPLKKPVEYAEKGGMFSVTGDTDWYKGFQAHHGGWTENLQKAQKAQKAYVQGFDSGTVHLFDRFLAETRRDGIPVVFVYSPEHVDGQHFVANREQIFSYFRRFADKYNVPFLDYSNDSLCRDRQYFYDSQHLNAVGTEIFSKRLAEDLKPYYNKAAAPKETVLQ